jgi:hypothetical protein
VSSRAERDEQSLERARQIAREHGPPTEQQQRRIRVILRQANAAANAAGTGPGIEKGVGSDGRWADE